MVVIKLIIKHFILDVCIGVKVILGRSGFISKAQHERQLKLHIYDLCESSFHRLPGKLHLFMLRVSTFLHVISKWPSLCVCMCLDGCNNKHVHGTSANLPIAGMAKLPAAELELCRLNNCVM